jgi:hypothetical protein
MAICINKKITFLHIAKNGGTSLTQAMLDQWPCEYSGNKHDKWNEIPEAWPKSFVAVIRNPYDRMVSLYEFARTVIRNQRGYKKSRNENLEYYDQQQKLLDRGFDVYLSEPERVHPKRPGQPLIVQNRKWQDLQQIHSLSPDWKKDTYVIRFENLKQELDGLAMKLNLPKLKLSKLNASVRKDYKAYYSDFSKKIVREAFDKDIVKFNYSF